MYTIIFYSRRAHAIAASYGYHPKLKFKVEKSGTYLNDLVTLESVSTCSPKWEGGQKIKIYCTGQTQTTTVINESREYNQRSQYLKLVNTSAGKVRFVEVVEYQLSIIPEDFPVNKIVFTFKEIRLNPEK